MEKDELSELKEVLGVAKEEIPALISSIMDGIYNAESGEKLAEDTANFYQKLVDAGMEKDQAFELTKEFMKSRDVSSLAKKAVGGDSIIRSNTSMGENSEDTEEDA